MTNQSWPKEPWKLLEKYWDIKDFEGNTICDMGNIGHAPYFDKFDNDIKVVFHCLNRIVSCVNALAGIEDPEAFVKEAKLAIKLNKEAQQLTEGFSEEDRKWFKEQGGVNNESN